MRDIRSATRWDTGRFGFSYGRPSAAAGAATASVATMAATAGARRTGSTDTLLIGARDGWRCAGYPARICPLSNDARARTLGCRAVPARRIRVSPTEAMRDGFEAVRHEAGVPEAFGADAEAQAQRAAQRTSPAGPRVEIPFVTIDPPGSRDLDQAMHIERTGEGHRVRYAIADVGAFVDPGGALDRDTHDRGVTIYAPDHNTPLHPPVLSEGA